MAQRDGAQTLAAHFRAVLRTEILSGHLPPGSRLQPAVLAGRYGTSTTVIREVLAQLSKERLVTARPNQGYYVVRLSLAELQDLTLVRCHNDTLALKLAIERGDLAWETDIMTAFHVLSRTARRSPDDPAHTTEEWAAAHRVFHLALLKACGVQILVDIAEICFDATELYRRWAAPSAAATQRCIDDEHRVILDACLARDTKQAQTRLAEHYQTTLDVILQAGLRADSETQVAAD